MKNNEEEKYELLSSFRNNGLVIDIKESEALSFLSLYSGEDICRYISFYGVVSLSGELVFVPGTTFSLLRRDILFDRELQNLVIQSGAVLHVDIERKIRAYREKRGRYDTALGKKSLEDVWFDFNTKYPDSLKESLGSSYGLTVSSFSSELEIISYAYERAREGRKLIDHIFLDADFPGSPSLRGDMISSVLILIDSLLDYSLSPIRGNSFSSLLSLLEKYGMDASRVGLTEKKNQIIIGI